MVVAHRNAWFTGRLADALIGAGLEVVARLDNGAHAVGVAVAEPPDLLLVEDALPMLTGAAVVREVTACAPSVLIAAQVAHEDGIAAMLDAGAAAVWSRRVPPVDLAAGPLALLPPRGA